METTTYQSLFAIGQSVKHRLFESDTLKDGVIVAIRFTKMKVFYDILNEYYGEMHKCVPSDNVFDINCSEK